MELMNHVLLIEDEPQLADAIKLALSKLGFSSHHISTLHQAYELTLQQLPDCILLDRSLPDGDGLNYCCWLRKQGYRGSVLMLTARGTIEDRVDGLDAGADDYLAKPFSWEELEARLRSMIRRRQVYDAAQTTTARRDEPSLPAWTMDEARLRILGPKGWVTLTSLEYKLATRLITAASTIVKREDLLKDVWGFKWLPQTRTVDYFMGRLRKNFEPQPERPRHFLTVRGVGYRFEL